jgi:hypothetical protein
VELNNFKDNPGDFIKDKQQLFELSENSKKLYAFKDAIIKNQYRGKLSSIHEACVNHYCYNHIDKLY